MIKITFLGTADHIPSVRRNHTSVLLSYDKENILIDCGEGTQRQFRKARLNPCKVTRILITHWHGDHILGLPGLLSTLALSGYNKKLFIYGPKGIKRSLGDLLKTLNFRKEYEIEVQEVSGKFLETDDFMLEAEKMEHVSFCNAYFFVRKGKMKIDKSKLKKSKLPSTSLLKSLKEGKDVIYQGKKYLSKNFVFKEEDVKISFIFDTRMNNRIIPFVMNSDLLISESAFASDLEEQALEHMHLTSKQAAEIAKKSNSKKLILTHISQRYEKNFSKILDEAKSIFKNSFLAKDLDVFNA
jgi:ribonuclease Z